MITQKLVDNFYIKRKRVTGFPPDCNCSSMATSPISASEKPVTQVVAESLEKIPRFVWVNKAIKTEKGSPSRLADVNNDSIFHFYSRLFQQQLAASPIKIPDALVSEFGIKQASLSLSQSENKADRDLYLRAFSEVFIPKKAHIRQLTGEEYKNLENAPIEIASHPTQEEQAGGLTVTIKKARIISSDD